MKIRVDERASPSPLPEVFGFRPFFLHDGRHVLAGRGDRHPGGLEGQLVVQSFDADTLELSGEPTALAEFGGHNGNTGPNFSVAGDRLIALSSRENTGFDLVWYTRDGTRALADDSGNGWWNPQLSFDDAFVAAVYSSGSSSTL